MIPLKHRVFRNQPGGLSLVKPVTNGPATLEDRSPAGHKMSGWWRALAVLTVAFAAYGATALLVDNTASPNVAYFDHLAQAFLDGHLYLADPPGDTDLTLPRWPLVRAIPTAGRHPDAAVGRILRRRRHQHGVVLHHHRRNERRHRQPNPRRNSPGGAGSRCALATTGGCYCSLRWAACTGRLRPKAPCGFCHRRAPCCSSA